MMQFSLKKKSSHHLCDGINNQNIRQQYILTDRFPSLFEIKAHTQNTGFIWILYYKSEFCRQKKKREHYLNLEVDPPGCFQPEDFSVHKNIVVSQKQLRDKSLTLNKTKNKETCLFNQLYELPVSEKDRQADNSPLSYLPLSALISPTLEPCDTNISDC